MSKVLVAYFSTGGNTRRAAKALATAAGADLYEIKPVQPYSHADLNWMDKKSRSTIEMNDPSSRPEIVGPLPDVSGYDTNLLGFPVWWYTCPAIIRTFLEGLDLHGKKLVPFATSGGSGLSRMPNYAAELAPGADFLPPLALRSAGETDKIDEWLKTLA